MERSESDQSAMTWAALGTVLEDVEATGDLDFAVILSPTGDVLAGHTRDGLRLEVIGVMSATMTASVDTLLEELRGRRPDLVVVEAGGERFAVSRAADDNLLVLAASSASSKRQLVASAQALRSKLAGTASKGKLRKPTVLPRP